MIVEGFDTLASHAVFSHAGFWKQKVRQVGIFGEWLRRNQYGVFLEWNEEDGEWALVPLEADGSPKVPGWAALLEYLLVQAGGTREHACVDDRDSPCRVAVQAGARSYCARAAVCRPSGIGDTASRPKGGWVEYRNGPQCKPSIRGKKQGDVFKNSKAKHGFGPYARAEMMYRHIYQQARSQCCVLGWWRVREGGKE